MEDEEARYVCQACGNKLLRLSSRFDHILEGIAGRGMAFLPDEAMLMWATAHILVFLSFVVFLSFIA